jgi:hypothetical protein
MSQEILTAIAELRGDIKADLATLRGEMNTGFATVNGRIDAITVDLADTKEAARIGIGIMDGKFEDMKKHIVENMPTTQAVSNMITTSEKDSKRFTISQWIALATAAAGFALVAVELLHH